MATYWIDDDHESRVRLWTNQSLLELVDHSSARVHVLNDPELVPGSEREVRQPLPADATRIEVLNFRRNATLILIFEDWSQFETPEVTVLPAVNNVTVSSGSQRAEPTLEPFPPGYDFPNGHFAAAAGIRTHAVAETAKLVATGTLTILVSGADIVATNSTGATTWKTGAFAEPERISGADVPSTRRYHHVAARGRIEAAVEAELVTPAHVLASTAIVSDVTHLSAPQAGGQVPTADQDIAVVNGSFVEVFGQFDAAYSAERSDDSRQIATLTGHFDGVRINRGQPVFGPPAFGVAVGLGLVSLLLVLLRQLWAVIAAARVDPATVALHPVRHQMLRMLDEEFAFFPLGAFRRAAAARCGIREITVYYHVMRLKRAGLVEIVRHGSRGAVYVAPNHGTFPDDEMKAATVLANSPTARRVCHVLVLQGEATLKDVHAELNERHGLKISKPAVLKWLRRLRSFELSSPAHPESPRRVALVLTNRAGRNPAYRATPMLVAVSQAIEHGARGAQIPIQVTKRLQAQSRALPPA